MLNTRNTTCCEKYQCGEGMIELVEPAVICHFLCQHRRDVRLEVSLQSTLGFFVQQVQLTHHVHVSNLQTNSTGRHGNSSSSSTASVINSRVHLTLSRSFLYLLRLYRISAPAGIRYFYQIWLRQKSHWSRIVLPDFKSRFFPDIK